MKDTHPSIPEMGVVATLCSAPNGGVRLTLDDVRSLPMLDATSWQRESLFTYRDFDASALEDLALSREQFAEIGENIVIRLLALRTAGNRDGSHRAT